MAWSFASYESQSTNSLKLAMLELHISEVSAEVGPDLAISGRSRQHNAMVTYLQMLQKRRTELAQDGTTPIPATSPRARSSFTRLRPV